MKKNRHEKTRELINDNVIETQDELLRLLRKDGFDVTQATVSRDIKQLRVIKALDSNEVYRYMIPKGESATLKANYSDVFKSAVIKVDYALNDVVIKCHTGMANAACMALDLMDHSSVVGTVAGDDTILIITRTEDRAAELCRELREYIN